MANLPEPIGTAYQYCPVIRHGDVLYIAGQIAKIDDRRLHAVGRCGEEVDLETASRSAEIAAAQALAWAATKLETGEVLERILRVDVYLAVSTCFEGMSDVADAAARVFIDALGEGGRHARSVIGVVRLPRNATVLLEVTAVVGKPA
jgi:enamine deaminase RidA (YjgF/YER057c/UK114 family)